MNIHDATEQAYKNGYEAGANDAVNKMMARTKQLEDERDKLGILYEQLLKEKSDLDRRIGYLEGQIEAYQYCMNCRR